MPRYWDLMPGVGAVPEWAADDAARTRTIARLQRLRRGLHDELGSPPPRSPATLVLGSWNLREFDSPKGGARLEESYAYIAEIVSRFDLIAIQEVRDDLRALRRLMARLSDQWEYIVSDVTAGTAGNSERLAFLYDRRKVRFDGLAGELVLPPVRISGETVPVAQIARTPLMAGFVVGWTRFVLTTVHIIWGDDKAEPPERVEEIRQIATFLRRRTEPPPGRPADSADAAPPIDNFVLLGDFNIFDEQSKTFRVLTEDGGFTVPDGIRALKGSNALQNRKYDQIAYRAQPRRFQATGAGGTFDYYRYVFTDDDGTSTERCRPASDRSESGGPTRCPTTSRCGRSSASTSPTTTSPRPPPRTVEPVHGWTASGPAVTFGSPMGDGRDSPAPRHPRREQRSLVLWAAAGGAGLDPATIPREIAGTLAMPLHGVAAGLIHAARRAEMGIALAPQAWRNQLEPERRGEAFAALPYAQPHALAVETGALADSAAADYADAVLDAQLAAGATLATTPAHVFEREASIGRDNDLLLASATVAAWHERQGWRPPPQRPDDPPRELFATIAVRARHLPEAVPSLIARYAALPVDGFWLVLLDDDDTRTSARVAEGVTALALGLQEGGRPVVVAGAGAWHAALLASGVAATCVGVDGAQPTFPPDAAAVDGVTGIGVPVFHPAILGSAPHGAAGEEAREWLFAAHPCRCGEHLAYAPPRGRRETLRHNLACLAAEARDATRLTPVLDEARLAARVERANATRARLALPPLPPAWSAVPAAARSARAADAAAPGLSAGA